MGDDETPSASHPEMSAVVDLPTSVAGLRLRGLTRVDAAGVAEYHRANAKRLIRYSPGSEPPPADEAAVEAMIDSCPVDQLMLGVWLHETLIGVNYIVVYTDAAGSRCAGLGFGIDEVHEGRGYTTAAVVAMTTYALEEFEVAAVTALIAVGNLASRRVVEKVGLRLLSQDDDWTRYRIDRPR